MPPSGPERALPSPTAEASLLDWLLDALRPMNRTRVKQLLQHGQVLVNGAPTTQFNHRLRPGDRVAISRGGHDTGELKRAGIAIAYQDDELIVADKPPGLLTVATEGERDDTAFARLSAFLEARRAGRPFVVHRLDRDTSGLVLFARSASARDRLQENWEGVTKTYLAVVEGVPHPAEGAVENFLIEGRDLRVRVAVPSDEAKRAVSRYRVTATRGRHSLVEVELVTGRKHQIRVHLSGIGCPVIGDTVYGAKTNPARRLGLHAWRLKFAHPFTNRLIELESPLPDSLQHVIR